MPEVDYSQLREPFDTAPIHSVGEVAFPSTGSVVDVASGHAGWQRSAKRGADLLIAVVAAPLVLAVVAVCAALIAVIDRQKPFYVDRRVGRGGREFGCFKLRTMRCDDWAFDHYLMAHTDESKRWAEDRKVEHDPRVTRLGALLRKLSIDELPQFLNVIVGDMSLVGPRPLSQREFVARPQVSQLLLGQVRPGITGPWQVAGRSTVANPARIALDDQYARAWSLRGDLVIVLKTPLAVLERTGAQ